MENLLNLKNTNFYHIYPLGFLGAPFENKDNKVCYLFDKLVNFIPYFKELNINAIYLGPVFESTSHGYDTKDYFKIDRRLGDNNSFKKVIHSFKSAGIKVILDGVFNHVGREFWAFLDLLENGYNSKYKDYFKNIDFNSRSPYNDPFSYESWEGHYNLVKLNLLNNDVVNYLFDAIKMWIDEFDIDGIRFDAANCLDISFLKKVRDFTKSIKPDFWLMGEVIHGDYNYFANSNALDSITNYECFKGIYSSHNDHNYFEIAHSLNRQFGDGGIYKNISTYNFLDNHDVNRIASNLKNKEHLFNCYTILFTMPGVPSIYYGSEVSILGKKENNSDLPLRPELSLSYLNSNKGDLFYHIKKLGELKIKYSSLNSLNYTNVLIKNEQLVYKRYDLNEEIFVLLNLSNEKCDLFVDCLNGEYKNLLNDEVLSINSNVSLDKCSSLILIKYWLIFYFVLY